MSITQKCFALVQRYAPEINKRISQHLKMSGTSYRVDETSIKVGKACKYLYRAVDKEGNTIEFMLSAKRDVSAAKRFFKKMTRANHRRSRNTTKNAIKKAIRGSVLTRRACGNIVPVLSGRLTGNGHTAVRTARHSSLAFNFTQVLNGIRRRIKTDG